MDKKHIKRLVDLCFDKNGINEAKVLSVSHELQRSDLKKFIWEVKKRLAATTVRVVIPNEKVSTLSIVKELKQMFPNKKIKIEIDPELMVGLRVVVDDLIYEYNLKDILKRISTHLSQGGF